MVNDFVLRSMELKTSTLDLRDFIHAMLLGMYERTVVEKGFDTVMLEEKKQERMELIAYGNDPK